MFRPFYISRGIQSLCLDIYADLLAVVLPHDNGATRVIGNDRGIYNIPTSILGTVDRPLNCTRGIHPLGVNVRDIWKQIVPPRDNGTARAIGGDSSEPQISH